MPALKVIPEPAAVATNPVAAVMLPVTEGEAVYAGTTPTPPLARSCPTATSANEPITLVAVARSRAPATTVSGNVSVEATQLVPFDFRIVPVAPAVAGKVAVVHVGSADAPPDVNN